MIMRLSCVMPYGDWLWISPQPDAENHCSPSALQTLLGREFRHAVFDARHGFDAAAFAALSGTLKAGSWLVLLLPVWEEWENQPDADSLRWSDCPDPIATPHFVQHLKRVLTADNDAILWRQNQPFSLAHLLPVLTGTRDRRTTTRTTATLTAATDHASGRGSGNGCAWAR